MARTQTLVQLTDELVESLDRRAATEQITRSALIRDLLTQALDAERGEELSRRMIEGYREMPQETGEDAWGDLEAWTQANARRNLTALQAEEQS